MHVRTIASVGYKRKFHNATGIRLILTPVAGPYPMLPRFSAPVSGVDCPCPFFHANCLLLLASLLSSRNCSLLGRVVNSSLASPSHFRIRWDFMSKNPLSGFAPKQTRLLWRPNHIVLHLPPITKTIQVRRTRHAGHCWRSREEIISDVLLWTTTQDRAKAGRTYIQQLCEDTGCSPEDLPEAMNDREKWRERVRNICATSTTWWWWYI